MTLDNIKLYVEGVLKQWFPTKKTVLDKLSVNNDGQLAFDNKQVASFDAVNLYSENLLPTPLIITPEDKQTTDLSVSKTTTLSAEIENYTWAELRCHWNTVGGATYYHTHVLNTHKGTKRQWISQYWSNSTDNTMESKNGFIVAVYGTTLDLCFTDLEEGQIVIDELIGYKVREITDGTPFAHEHNNLDTLNKLSSQGNVLKINNTPINSNSYKKTIFSGSFGRPYSTSSSSTFNSVLFLSESALSFDELHVTINLTSGGQNYRNIEILGPISTGTNLWLAKWFVDGVGYNGNYTINSAGNIVFSSLSCPGFNDIRIVKVDGIKYGE